MPINITTKGFVEVDKTLTKPLAPVLTQAVYLATAFMTSKAKENQTNVIYNRPVTWKRTGKLRQSTTGKAEGTKGRVYVGVNYGSAVEYGTGKARAYPYFEPAVEATRNQIPVILTELLKKHYGK